MMEPTSDDLVARAGTILRDNMTLQMGEELLVVADETTLEVGRLFHEAARAMGCVAVLAQIPVGSVSGEEPPACVAAAMERTDVAFCVTAKSMTHTRARVAAAASGTRVVTMPGGTVDMLREGASCADYAEVEQLTRRMTERLTQAHIARIEKDGHTLTLDLGGRHGVASPGVFRAPGSSGNFPSGEAYIAPVETGAEGSMVIDGSMVGIGELESPLTVTLERGRLAGIEGGDSRGPYADRLQVLMARPENGTIAELGIGTNPDAILCGIILEDEKLYGSVHIAFGTNASFGGATEADCHYDGIILRPTLYLDDERIIEDGVFRG